jgi:hypothetical protein
MGLGVLFSVRIDLHGRDGQQHPELSDRFLHSLRRRPKPLVLATEARDLDELSNGRLVLGIGNGTKRMMGDWHGVPTPPHPPCGWKNS